MPLRMLPYPSDTSEGFSKLLDLAYHQLTYHSWIVYVKWGCFPTNVRLNLQTGFADCVQFIKIDVSFFLCSQAIHLENIAVAFLTKILHQHVCCHDFLHWRPVNSLRMQLAFIWDYGMPVQKLAWFCLHLYYCEASATSVMVPVAAWKVAAKFLKDVQ